MFLGRLYRVALTFALVLAAYGLYRVAAVPFIEPNITVRDAPGHNEEEFRRRDAMARQQKKLRLRPYFPEGSWELTGPKVLESEHGMLLLEDYQALDDGRLKLQPCSLVLFMRSEDEEERQQGRRAVVIQAPDGAVLEFDKPLDLRRGKFGKLIGGHLVGDVTIRADESEPGAGDELKIVTRNVQLDQERIWTPHPIRFRYGGHHGSGRDLLITLLTARGAGGGSPRPVGIKSVELVHVDEVLFQVPGRGLLAAGDSQREASRGVAGISRIPETTAAADRRRLTPHGFAAGFSRETSAASPPRHITAKPGLAAPGASHPIREENATPVEITCRGPFFFDLPGRVARFEKDVDVVRQVADGVSDQLNCQVLEIHFDARERRARKAGETEPDSRRPPIPALVPRRLLAAGRPVIIRAESASAWARGERLEYDFPTRRISLDGDRGVVLRHRDTTVDAATVTYQMPETGRIGRLWSKGAGKIDGTLGESEKRAFSARWQQEVRVVPDGPHHVISLLGEAAVRIGEPRKARVRTVAQQDARQDSLGEVAISGGELHLWIEEVPSGKQTPSAGDRGKTTIRPHRMKADGNVRIDSARLVCRAEQLQAWFRHAVAGAGDSPPVEKSDAASGPSRRPALRDSTGQSRFQVRGRTIKLQLLATGRQMTLRDAAITGGAEIRETDLAEQDAKPLVVTGESLKLIDAQSPQAELTVLGTPGRVAGRGYAIEGDHLRVDRAAGTATVDGPGKMWLPVAMAVTDPEEQGPRPPAQGQTETAEITWRGDMRFDGIQAVLTGEVTAVTSQQRGKADTVTVTLARKVDFLRLRQPGDVNVREFDLQGNVFFSSSTTDGQRTQAVDRMWLKNLHVDMHSGDMQSRGAGRVRSVRRQQGRSPLASLGGDQAAAKRSSERTTASQPSDPLFVGVTFERGLTGNIHRREATFHGNVRTVVGHVQDFDDVLDPMAAGGLKEDQMVITCDRLKAADMTRHAVRPGKLDTRPMGPLEIEALGGTHVEGRTFSAWAQRLSYAQAKDLLLMEGSGRALAEIHHQPRPGGPTSKYTAERLLFWPKSGKMEGDIRSLDVNNPDSAREPAP